METETVEVGARDKMILTAIHLVRSRHSCCMRNDTPQPGNSAHKCVEDRSLSGASRSTDSYQSDARFHAEYPLCSNACALAFTRPTCTFKMRTWSASVPECLIRSRMRRITTEPRLYIALAGWTRNPILLNRCANLAARSVDHSSPWIRSIPARSEGILTPPIATKILCSRIASTP